MSNTNDYNLVLDFNTIQNPWDRPDQSDYNLVLDFSTINSPWYRPDQTTYALILDFNTIINPFAPVANQNDAILVLDFSVIDNPFPGIVEIDLITHDWVPDIMNYFQRSVEWPEWQGLDELDVFMRELFEALVSWMWTNMTALPRWLVDFIIAFFKSGMWRHIRTIFVGGLSYGLGWLSDSVRNAWNNIKTEHFFKAITISASDLNEYLDYLPDELRYEFYTPKSRWDLSAAINLGFNFSDVDIYLPNFLKQVFTPNIPREPGKTQDELWEYIFDILAFVLVLLITLKLPKLIQPAFKTILKAAKAFSDDGAFDIEGLEQQIDEVEGLLDSWGVESEEIYNEVLSLQGGTHYPM